MIASQNWNEKVAPVCTHFPNTCRGSTYGYVADNILHNGGASHNMYQWRQVIFERNIASGASVIAMGQPVGVAADGGYAHHILHADNVIDMVSSFFFLIEKLL